MIEEIEEMLNKNQNSIESYFVLTGNPFVDAGVYYV